MGTLLYVGWEEVIVSNEKGKREVHYLLKRRDGKSPDLAVIGKERTLRHMFYNFVLRSSRIVRVPVGKLKSRREVLDWLSSVVPSSDPYSNRSSQQFTRFPDNQTHDSDLSSLKDSHVRNLGLPSKEFLWVGPATCRKRRKHYQSFLRNGITISVNDFVYVLAEENKRLVAYLEDLYEDSRSNRMVVVRWFHKIDEVGIILPPNFNDREIFFSLCLQDLSVECIDGLAAVLGPQHFEKYLNVAAHTPWQPFMCHRQFHDDVITDYDITKVKGYWNQELLKTLDTPIAPKQSKQSVSGGLEFHDGDSDDDEDAMKTRPRKKQRRSKSKENDRCLSDERDTPETSPLRMPKLSNGSFSPAEVDPRGLADPKPTPKPTCHLPAKELTQQASPKPTCHLPAKELTQHAPRKHLAVGCHVEVLSQDSGIRGCWFRAVIIKRSKVKVKVRYEDIKDAEDDAKCVEEWVLASRIAARDDLGVRLHGRTTVRPYPLSNKDEVSLGFVAVGTPVDAFWHDGWWEGIVIRKDSDDKIHVYFPGEKKVSIFCCNDLRRAQDWFSNKWNILESKSDIASSILSGLESKQNKDTSAIATNDKQPDTTSNVISTVLPKEAKSRLVAPPIEQQKPLVPNLAKDNLLSQLRWNPSRKRRRAMDRSQRQRRGSGSSGSSSSREEMETSPDCQRFLTPSSLKFDHESCKYQGDSLLNPSSITPLTGLVLSR